MPFLKIVWIFYYSRTDFFFLWDTFRILNSAFDKSSRLQMFGSLSSRCWLQLSTWSGTRGATCWSRCRRARCCQTPCLLWCTLEEWKGNNIMLCLFTILYFMCPEFIYGIFTLLNCISVVFFLIIAFITLHTELGMGILGQIDIQNSMGTIWIVIEYSPDPHPPLQNTMQ